MTCWAHVHPTDRQTRLKNELKTSSPKWMRTTTVSWLRRSSWRVASKTKNSPKCLLHNECESELPNVIRQSHHITYMSSLFMILILKVWESIVDRMFQTLCPAGSGMTRTLCAMADKMKCYIKTPSYRLYDPHSVM